MKVCVMGLWHLGCVTAACLSKLGIEVIGVAQDEKASEDLNRGILPIYEPGLQELVLDGLRKGTLYFTSDLKAAVKQCRYTWICFDTPVDENDNADEEFVIGEIEKACKYLEDGQGIIISSQLSVGSAKRIETFKTDSMYLAVSPENLRLGKAIDVFMNPDRMIVGVRTGSERDFFAPVFRAVTDKIIWMNPESAEMVKHAINGFLASSVVFINEIASICEEVGADAGEVSRGLLTEKRIGSMAYLKPGSAWGGGTLARDIKYLIGKAEKNNVRIPQIESTWVSNSAHKDWAYQKVCGVMEKYPKAPFLNGHKKTECNILVLGLTYKADTDTLRRSLALEMVHKLSRDGFKVAAFDIHIAAQPDSEKGAWILADDPITAIRNAQSVILTMDSKEYETMGIYREIVNRGNLLVIDENAFLADQEFSKGTWYCTVGKEIRKIC